MKKILFVLLAVLLIFSIFATGCKTSVVKSLAPIADINIWADESSPPQYFLHIVSVEPSTCHRSYKMPTRDYLLRPWSWYNVKYDDNTIRVEIFDLEIQGMPCLPIVNYVDHIIPLRSWNFTPAPGETYTVVVNNVTETFVA